MNRLFTSGEIGRRAIVRYAEALGETYSRFKSERDLSVPAKCEILLRMVMRKHSEWLRKDDWSWGKVGYALVSQNRMKAAARWLSDWKGRPQAASWMLYNLVIALHHTNRDSDALEVCRYAVGLRYEHGIQESFKVSIAVEEALAGNTVKAVEFCAGLNPERLEGRNKYLHGLAQAMLKVQSVPENERATAFKEAKSIIKKTFAGSNVFDTGKSMRRFYRRSVRRIAYDCGGVWPKIWSWWHQCSRTPMLIILLVGGIIGAVFNPKFWPLLFFYGVGIFSYLRWKR